MPGACRRQSGCRPWPLGAPGPTGAGGAAARSRAGARTAGCVRSHRCAGRRGVRGLSRRMHRCTTSVPGERLGWPAATRMSGARPRRTGRLPASPHSNVAERERARRGTAGHGGTPSRMGRVGPYRNQGDSGSLFGQLSAIIAVNCPNNAMAMAPLPTLPVPLDLPALPDPPALPHHSGQPDLPGHGHDRNRSSTRDRASSTLPPADLSA